MIIPLLSGCDPTKAFVELKQEAKEPTTLSITNYDYGWLSTVTHDNHLFVVEGRNQKGAILHHPDCPCQKK